MRPNAACRRPSWHRDDHPVIHVTVGDVDLVRLAIDRHVAGPPVILRAILPVFFPCWPTGARTGRSG